ncbi:MAG TPA: HEAT repeat domain-containing protein, partial [Gemmataceae bacterium]|nr:HEAT repeat domain-containing protein [Gemmataceae bacterium]
MKNRRKRLIVSLAVLLGVCGIAVVADPTCVLLGLLRNESFYQGRPTTYWSREIERLQGTKSTSWLDTCQDWFLNLFRSNGPLTKDELALLKGRREAVPVLKELLRDKTPFVRWTAAFELFYTKNAEPTELIPALCEALQDPDDYSTRSCAAKMLECLVPDPETEMAVPALILALNDTPKFRIRVCVSGMAHNILYRLGARAVPALIEGLKDPDIARRREVARVLGRIGLEARAAVPALHEALNDRF